MARSYPKGTEWRQWDTRYLGQEPSFHYALRIGSDIHRANFATRGPVGCETTATPVVEMVGGFVIMTKQAHADLIAERDSVYEKRIEDLIAERDRCVEAASEHGTQANRLRKENEVLRKENEVLRKENELFQRNLQSRGELIGRIKGVMNELMDY